MFLFKRHGIYYIEFIDPVTQKNKRKSTGKKIKKEALDYVREFEKILVRSNIPKCISLYEFENEYVELKSRSHSHRYVDSIKYSFNELKKFLIPSTPLERINNIFIEKFIMGIFQRSESLAGLIYRTLKAAFYKAEAWGYIERNPFCKVKFPRIKRNHPIFFGEDILNKIIAKESNEELKFLYLFGFNTGLRLSEILNLRWKDINEFEKTISVVNSEEFTTKNKKERIVPLNEFIYARLLEKKINKNISYADLSGYIFTKIGRVKYDAGYISKKFKKAVRANKDIDQNIHFHSLRHSFASSLVQRGVSLYVIKALLGHEDLSTTQIYSHLQRENLFDAVRLLNSNGRVEKCD
jgi:site-specific recombinase XerD